MINREKTQNSADRYYQKKLHTQSCSMSDFSNFQHLSRKIEIAVKNAEQQSLLNHRKMIEAQQRKQQIEKRSMDSRNSLRSNIQQKMRESQINIKKMHQNKKKQRQNKNKFQQTTRQRISSMQKKFLDQSFLRSINSRTQSKKFFELKSQKQKEKNERLQTIHNSSRVQARNSDKNCTVDKIIHNKSFIVNKKNSKPSQHHILKIDDEEIRKHQNKKVAIQINKQSKNLAQYIEKMQQISNHKTKILKRTFVQKPTLPKIKKDLIQPQDQSMQRYNKNKPNSQNNSPMRSAIKNRVSFSEIYNKKLKEKRYKMQLFHNLSQQQCDQISYRQKYISQRNKQFKIIKETVNQVKRKCHFNYMKMLHKR